MAWLHSAGDRTQGAVPSSLATMVAFPSSVKECSCSACCFFAKSLMMHFLHAFLHMSLWTPSKASSASSLLVTTGSLWILQGLLSKVHPYSPPCLCGTPHGQLGVWREGGSRMGEGATLLFYLELCHLGSASLRSFVGSPGLFL